LPTRKTLEKDFLDHKMTYVDHKIAIMFSISIA
jgi:hypothetical protein